MLRRKPTRIEMVPEDMHEYEEMKIIREKEQAAAASAAASAAAHGKASGQFSKSPPIIPDNHKSIAERLGVPRKP